MSVSSEERGTSTASYRPGQEGTDGRTMKRTSIPVRSQEQEVVGTVIPMTVPTKVQQS